MTEQIDRLTDRQTYRRKCKRDDRMTDKTKIKHIGHRDRLTDKLT